MMATHRRRRRPVTRSLSIGGLHEIFLVSSIGMILIIRLQLWATNYPTLSSGRLHFAHLLWGGLLMLAAIIYLTFIVVYFVLRFIRPGTIRSYPSCKR